MTRTARHSRMIALVASTALATMALGGCATKAAPRADLSASRAETALAKGNKDGAIANAEAAVLADPRNAASQTALTANHPAHARSPIGRSNIARKRALT